MITEEVGPKVSELPSGVVAATLDVYKIYKTGELETVALRGVSLSISEGEMLAIVGPSGAGKSTLLGVLGGMLQPTAGAVHWSCCEGDVSKLDPERVVRIRQRFIGFVFQEGNLLPQLTARQNVELSARVAGLPNPRDRAEYLLKRVGLGDRLGFIPGMLSTGERQRVAIAGALINDPKLILADEPTGNIDVETSEEILELFKELNEETGVGFFIVTHSQQVASRARRIIEIKDGVLVGLHGEGADVRDLDRSRILNLDVHDRLSIPLHLLDQLGNPREFQVKIEKGELVLTPTSKSKEGKE
jgi:putative ABC transport system ATP-binding protein